MSIFTYTYTITCFLIFQHPEDFDSEGEASNQNDRVFVPKSYSSNDSSHEDLPPFFDPPKSKCHAVPEQFYIMLYSLLH